MTKAAMHLTRLFFGWLGFLATGKTPDWGHQSMIRLFCLTGGRSNDALSRLVSAIHRGYALPTSSGVLGQINEQKSRDVAEHLSHDGYYLFDRRLPDDVCDRLVEFALSTPARVRPMDNQLGEPIREAIYDPLKPLGVRYDFKTQDLVNNVDIQQLMSDLSLVTVAQNHLKAPPFLDAVSMWWTCAYGSQPDRMAAQEYHFDMDRIKWLKFFIHLTDVGPGNGPHTFVSGSHKAGAIPPELLKHGYARLSDEEVKPHLPAGSFIEFNTPRGTIMAEDTRGLHKGKAVETGGRLMLEIQFTNSLFGASSESAKLPKALGDDLRKRIESYPRLYSFFTG